MKAVIFDMDGVLFDTENLVSKSWQAVAKEDGIKGIEEVLRECIGRSYEDAREIFYNVYGKDFEFDAFRAKEKVIFTDYIEKNGLPIKPGVEEILAYLKAEGYRLAIASSSKKESVLSHLARTGLADYFEVIVGGDMVAKSKPNPEIYQKACKLLGVEPSESYCIEDSLNGVRAGHAAGLTVIMVPDLIPPTEEIEALLHQKCETLVEVQTYLQTQSKKNEIK